MSLTISAWTAVSERNTVFTHCNRMSNADSGLFLACDLMNCTGRTHFATAGTLRTTISSFVRNLGLHEMSRIAGRTQNTIGTGRNTKLATGAMA